MRTNTITSCQWGLVNCRSFLWALRMGLKTLGLCSNPDWCIPYHLDITSISTWRHQCPAKSTLKKNMVIWWLVHSFMIILFLYIDCTLCSKKCLVLYWISKCIRCFVLTFRRSKIITRRSKLTSLSNVLHLYFLKLEKLRHFTPSWQLGIHRNLSHCQYLQGQIQWEHGAQ